MPRGRAIGARAPVSASRPSSILGVCRVVGQSSKALADKNTHEHPELVLEEGVCFCCIREPCPLTGRALVVKGQESLWS